MEDRGVGTGDRVAVVLTGAPARGAYQAGVLMELLPALEECGMKPSILVGASTGAFNAALLGSWADLGVDQWAHQLAAVWSDMAHLTNSAVSLQYENLFRWASATVLGVGPGLSSVFDLSPMTRVFTEHFDVHRLHANVSAGQLDAVGVIATRVPPATSDMARSAGSSQSVLFLDEHEPTGFGADGSVARCPIGVEHVAASFATPVLFPAQRVAEPSDAAGWYIDGMVRLTAPLQPAIDLGATKVIVVSANSLASGPGLPSDATDEVPNIADSVAQAMHSMFADHVAEHVRTVHAQNRMLYQVAALPRLDAPTPIVRPDGSPYRIIETAVISPPLGLLGEVASRVFEEQTAGAGFLFDLDNYMLGRVLGAGDSAGRREIISDLYFDEEYFAASIEIGRKAACGFTDWLRGEAESTDSSEVGRAMAQVARAALGERGVQWTPDFAMATRRPAPSRRRTIEEEQRFIARSQIPESRNVEDAGFQSGLVPIKTKCRIP